VGGKGGGWGQGGEMTQALYAHMNNKTIKKKKGVSGLQNHLASGLTSSDRQGEGEGSIMSPRTMA
jgi:hypothetical protein